MLLIVIFIFFNSSSSSTIPHMLLDYSWLSSPAYGQYLVGLKSFIQCYDRTL